MAQYKREHFLTKSESRAYDEDHEPGTQAPFGGVYRCMGCDLEIGIGSRQMLPMHYHHTHTPEQGLIQWRLIVWPIIIRRNH
jgi:hypothetical protein